MRNSIVILDNRADAEERIIIVTLKIQFHEFLIFVLCELSQLDRNIISIKEMQCLLRRYYNYEAFIITGSPLSFLNLQISYVHDFFPIMQLKLLTRLCL